MARHWKTAAPARDLTNRFDRNDITKQIVTATKRR
jgi:hypothetical protein